MNKPKHKLYTTAETLFVEQGMTCTATAEMLGIREGTLSEWRKNQLWDDKRKKAISTPDAIRRLLLDELQSISAGNKPRIDTDGLSKVAKTIQYFDGRVALSVVISVLKEVDNYIAEIDPGVAVDMAKYHQMFVTHRAKIDSLK